MGTHSKWRPRLLRIALALVILYAAACLIITAFQRRLIYFPTRLNEAAAERWAAEVQLQPWRNARGEIIGWKREAKGSAGEVLVLHGNAGCAIDRDFYANKLQQVEALDVYLLEYPGYGSRGGSPTETSIIEASREALELLKGREPLFVVGESLGSGAACYLAGQFSNAVAGLALVTPYNNFAAAAQKHMPIFPVRWMLKDQFPSDRHLRSYQGPVAVLLGGRDEVIPSSLGRKLYDGYRGRAKLWNFPQATHNDVPSSDPHVWREVIAFWHHPEPVAREVVQ